MRILWISASIFDDQEEKQSGVWQKAMAVKLSEQNSIILGNISYQSQTKSVTKSVHNNIIQWGIPRMGKSRKGIPPQKVCILFEQAVNEFNPDIIHVWGSENPFKLLPFDKKFPGIKVLSMQGILGSIADCILNGLTTNQVLSTIGLREIILRNNLFIIQNSFYKEAEIESQMIISCKHIITQSEWTESQIRHINYHAKFHRIDRILRPDFIKAQKWTSFKHQKPIIYSAAVGYSLKGLHILIKALFYVKAVYPSVELRLTGAIGRTDFLGDGYNRLINKMIRKFDLSANVTWLGAITASKIVSNLQEASVFVNPSYIESYSLVVAEAMSIGTPSVISFAGAMPEIAIVGKEALFFTPGDYKQCASQIIKLLSDIELSTEISYNSQKKADFRNISSDIIQQQISIYKDIIDYENNYESRETNAPACDK